MKNKIDKYYSKLVNLNSSSPKNKEMSTLNNLNTNNLSNTNTYSLTYKEKIMQKTQKINIQN